MIVRALAEHLEKGSSSNIMEEKWNRISGEGINWEGQYFDFLFFTEDSTGHLLGSERTADDLINRRFSENSMESPVFFNDDLFYLSVNNRDSLNRNSLSAGLSVKMALPERGLRPYFLCPLGNNLYLSRRLGDSVKIFKYSVSGSSFKEVGISISGIFVVIFR
jgi:hypothetical protein